MASASFQVSLLYKDICIFVHIFVVTGSHCQCYFTDGSTIFLARTVGLEKGGCVCVCLCVSIGLLVHAYLERNKRERKERERKREREREGERQGVRNLHI